MCSLPYNGPKSWAYAEFVDLGDRVQRSDRTRKGVCAFDIVLLEKKGSKRRNRQRRERAGNRGSRRHKGRGELGLQTGEQDKGDRGSNYLGVGTGRGGNWRQMGKRYNKEQILDNDRIVLGKYTLYEIEETWP